MIQSYLFYFLFSLFFFESSPFLIAASCSFFFLADSRFSFESLPFFTAWSREDDFSVSLTIVISAILLKQTLDTENVGFESCENGNSLNVVKFSIIREAGTFPSLMDKSSIANCCLN